MSTDPVTTVLFDLDETICEFRRTSNEVLTLAFEHVGVEPLFPVTAYHSIAERYMDDAEEKDERRALCFADLVEERGYDRSVGREVATAYDMIRDHGNVQFLPGVEDVLDRLAESYRLGLVTNGEPAMQDPKLAALEIADLFEVIIYAGIDTQAKPASEPFAVALDTLDVRPNETVYIGNSLESDIAGANAAGLSSVWMPYNSPEESKSEPKPSAPVPDYHIASAEALGPQLWDQSSFASSE